MHELKLSIPCPRTDVRCPQGMVLESCHVGPRGGTLRRPRLWYRCQDCDLILVVYDGPVRNGAPLRELRR